MLNTAFAPWPSFSSEEGEAVKKVLLSNRVNYWTGELTKVFEHEFARSIGTDHAVAVANGSLALELALRALDIGPGDDVVVTPRTFLASASCVINVGARPIFADVDSDSQNITAQTIEAALTPSTKAVIPVHLAGWPCEMDAIMSLAARRSFHIVEDCAQAHGARYKGQTVGSFGTVGAWSFCQDKIITTGGEGGMVTTNDKDLWLKMWAYKDHGKSWSAVYDRQHAPGFRWLHESFGTNWRMLEMQAAIGLIQLRRLQEWVDRRRSNAQQIADACKPFPVVRIPKVPNHLLHSYYKFYVFIRPENLKKGWSRNRVLREIVGRGVPCYEGSCSEVYLEKAFDRTNYRPKERLPIARMLGETSIMFLVHPTLTEANLQKTCAVASDVFRRASR